MLAANVLSVLKARGIGAVPELTELRERFGGSSSDALMSAALACTDAADFRRRLGAPGAGSLCADGPPSGQR